MQGKLVVYLCYIVLNGMPIPVCTETRFATHTLMQLFAHDQNFVHVLLYLDENLTFFTQISGSSVETKSKEFLTKH